MITINRAIAEETVRDRLRVERSSRLKSLDVEFMRALESGTPTAAIVADKQALRDVTDINLSALTLPRLASLSLDEALTEESA